MAEKPRFEFRGTFRGILVKRWDEGKFRALPPMVKLVLLNLETGPNSNLPRIFPLYKEPIQKQTGLTGKEVDDALDFLSQNEWIFMEDGLIWVKDGLRDDPNVSFRNQSHVTGIRNALACLPESSLINRFMEYYGFRRQGVDRESIGSRLPTVKSNSNLDFNKR